MEEEKKKTQWEQGGVAVPINNHVHAAAWAVANSAQVQNI